MILPNNPTINQIKDGVINNSVYSVTGNVNGTAGTWTGTLEGLTAYYDGLKIYYHIGTTGASTTKLNINSLGAKTVYRYASTKLGTQYGVNYIIPLVYSSTLNGGCWMVMADYDTTETYTVRSRARFTAGSVGVFPYSLFAETTNGSVESFTTTSGTGTSKVANTSAKFVIGKPIYYYNYNETIESGSRIRQDYAYIYAPTADVRYTGNYTDSSFGTYKSAYLNITIDKTTNTYSPTNNLIVSGTNLVSGQYYIYLGNSYSSSAYQISKINDVAIYYYNGANLVKTDITNPTKTSELTNDSGFITSSSIPTKLSSFTDDLGSSPVHTHSQYLTQHQSLSGYVPASRTIAGIDLVDNVTTNELKTALSVPSAGSTATAVSTTASGGSATTWSKSDHVHNIALATGDANGQVKIAGTNVSVKGLGSNAYTSTTIPTTLSQLTDDATHRIVTDTEKSTWNGKQNAITSTNKLSYSLLSDTPTIPTVNNPTISIKQGATIKGSFTLNQSGNQTIQIDAGTGGASNWGDIGGTLSNQTDLQDALDLKANLRTSLQSVPYGTAVPASIDLNTLPYIRVGNYYCSQNATAQTQTNCPTTSAYMMVVYSPLSVDNIDKEETATWVYRTRLLRDLGGNEYYQLVQSNSTAGSFSYGPWIKTARTSEISNSTITINQGGTQKGTFTLNGSATTINLDGIPSNLAYTNVDNNFSVKQTVTGGMKVTGRYQGSGDDEGLVVGLASNNYAGVILGDPSGERVVLYNNAGSHTAMVRHNNGSSSYDMKFPDVSGDIVVLSSADYTKLKALLNQIQANPSSSGVTFLSQVNAPTFNGTT